MDDKMVPPMVEWRERVCYNNPVYSDRRCMPNHPVDASSQPTTSENRNESSRRQCGHVMERLMTKTVALIFGGQSPEHEVSIVSARFIRDELAASGFDVLPLGIDINGQWHCGEGAFDYLCNHAGDEWSKTRGIADLEALTALCRQAVDVVFPLVHGITGEDGCLQGLLEMCNIPYVGGCPLNQSLCFDKLTTRQVLAWHGLPQPKFRALYRREFGKTPRAALDGLIEDLGFPVFVKPSRTGSSIGVNKAIDRISLETALDVAFSFDSRVIVEEAIQGQEIEISALGGEDPFFSVPGEVLPENEFYDFAEKYLKGTTRFDIPAKLSRAQSADMMRDAAKAWQVLHCYGLARIDFLITSSTVFLNEVNTVPGFTSISMYPTLLQESGVSTSDLLARLIELAESRFYKGGRKSVFCSQSDWFKG